jgi:hypothetical protein
MHMVVILLVLQDCNNRGNSIERDIQYLSYVLLPQHVLYPIMWTSKIQYKLMQSSGQ